MREREREGQTGLPTGQARRDGGRAIFECAISYTLEFAATRPNGQASPNDKHPASQLRPSGRRLLLSLQLSPAT